MFETLQMAPPDAILGLTEAFKADSNPAKINLSVGVYQNGQGVTPILDSVKQAERRLIDSETSKGYLGIDGLPAYAARVRELLFGADHEILTAARAATVQTPGGTGALRVAADFVVESYPDARIWCSKPTWANHPNIFKAAGLEVKQYSYLNAEGIGLDFEGMLRDLSEAKVGDVICLHACCHNPTGVDPTPEQWAKIGDLVQEKGLLPLVDFAYQGFGDGLTSDAAGLLELARPNAELLVCSSFSKNFSLYGERVGALTVVASDTNSAQAVLSHMKARVRSNYSNPPRHGASIVAEILGCAELRQLWEQEVDEMRGRIKQMRSQFVAAMKERKGDQDFSFIDRQRGMFSFSGLTPLQVDELRKRYSIYIVGSGRINVAGMTEKNLPTLCDAIAAVL
ncbi:amino acid aminotransferase [Lignipirellula cremea]|uniref:Aminotransferase n=1 Tax=Lignipirellula cremea TaxID=2528010 RepID=A0A518DLW7_9BACT|nr:amino acid aminotransferase [Lignipirellula cremea]QDU92836.1 Aspartate aminotransferase [Lignipirellula cremea]